MILVLSDFLVTVDQGTANTNANNTTDNHVNNVLPTVMVHSSVK